MGRVRRLLPERGWPVKRSFRLVWMRNHADPTVADPRRRGPGDRVWVVPRVPGVFPVEGAGGAGPAPGWDVRHAAADPGADRHHLSLARRGAGRDQLRVEPAELADRSENPE